MEHTPLEQPGSESTPVDRAPDDIIDADRSPRAYPPIVVSVGTDHHPFDRLVTWMDEWSSANPEIDVLIQRGTSVEARNCRSTQLVPHPELCEFFARAILVVSHGGPSTVMDARMTGRRPIVVPRDPAFGEHVDDHQMRFADHLHRHELAEVVNDRAALFETIAAGLAEPERFSVTVEQDAGAGIVEFGRVVDQLLSTTTPLMPNPPNDVGAIVGRLDGDAGRHLNLGFGDAQFGDAQFGDAQFGDARFDDGGLL